MRSAGFVTLATIVVASLASAVVPVSAAPKDDACAFLTKQDAVAALGEDVTPLRRDNPVCRWGPA